MTKPGNNDSLLLVGKQRKAQNRAGNSANINNKGLTYNGNVVYHAGNKPTVSEIGASDANHNHNGVYIRKYAANIGNGTSTTIKVTHNLGTEDVTVTVREVSSKQIVMADVQIVDGNSINILFASAPASNTYRVVVTG